MLIKSEIYKKKKTVKEGNEEKIIKNKIMKNNKRKIMQKNNEKEKITKKTIMKENTK